MKILLLLSVFVSYNVNADHNVFHSPENIMVLPIIKVVDGDTIKTALSLPEPLNRISVRIAKIDTPESTWRAKCDKEKKLGLQAKEFLSILLMNEPLMILKNFNYGTYAGRIIADVEVNSVDLGTVLIEKGLAKPYDGKIKPSWCE